MQQNQGIIPLTNIIHKTPQLKGEEPSINDESYSFHDLITACENNDDMDTILHIINNLKDLNINQSDSFQNTPLLYASKNNNLELITLFLTKFKANPNIENESHEIPLHWSVQHGNPEAIKLLLEYNSNIHHSNLKKQTPLQLAQHHQNQDAVLLMTKAKQFKPTEFQSMIQEGNLMKIKEYLSVIENHKAIIYQQDKSKINYLQYALNFKKIPIIKLLIEEGAQVNKRDQNQQTILHALFKSFNKVCDQELIDDLVRNKADFTLRDIDGNTPTILALQNDSQKDDLIDKIIKGCKKCFSNQSFLRSLTILNANNITALQYVFENKLFKIIELFLDYLPNINIRVALNSDHLLFRIFQTENEEVIQKFISKNPNLNLQNHYGDTILHILCRDSQPKINLIKQVLEKGANQLIQNKDDEIPLFIVAKKGSTNLDILELILQLRYLTQDLTKLQKLVDKQGRNFKEILKHNKEAIKLIQQFYIRLDNFQQEFNEIKRSNSFIKASQNINDIFYQSIQRQDMKIWEFFKKYEIKLFPSLIKKSQNLERKIELSKTTDPIEDLIVSSNPRILAIHLRLEVIIWDIESEIILCQVKSEYYIKAAQFSRDAKYLYTVIFNRIQVWDIQANKEVKNILLSEELNNDAIISFSRNKIAFSNGKTIKIQTLENEYKNTITINQCIDFSTKLNFLADSNILIINSPPQMRFFDAKKGYLLDNFSISQEKIRDYMAKYFPSKNMFLFCRKYTEFKVQFFNISTEKIIKTIQSGPMKLEEGDFFKCFYELSPDEKSIFCYGYSIKRTQIKLINIQKQKFIRSQWLEKPRLFQRAKYLSCGQKIVLQEYCRCSILNLKNWTINTSFTYLMHPWKGVSDFVENEDSIITKMDTKLLVFDRGSSKLEQEQNLEQEFELGLMSNSGNLFLTKQHGKVQIRDTKTLKIVKSLQLNLLYDFRNIHFQSDDTLYYRTNDLTWKSVTIFGQSNLNKDLSIPFNGCFTSDGLKFASSESGKIKIFDVSTGKCIQQPKLMNRNFTIYHIEFISPKKLMVLATDYKNLYFWDNIRQKSISSISISTIENTFHKSYAQFYDHSYKFIKQGQFCVIRTKIAEQIIISTKTGEIMENFSFFDGFLCNAELLVSNDDQMLASNGYLQNLNVISDEQLNQFESYDYNIAQCLISLIENRNYISAIEIINQSNIDFSKEGEKVLYIAKEKNARTVIELIQENIKQKQGSKGQCCNIF